MKTKTKGKSINEERCSHLVDLPLGCLTVKPYSDRAKSRLNMPKYCDLGLYEKLAAEFGLS
jgi:hypothetical protein